MKTCFKCGVAKPLDEFYKHPQMGDGRLNKCKECAKRDVSVRHRALQGDTVWVQKERARGREKYYRLYRGKYHTTQETRRRWAQKNTHKTAVHSLVNRAIRDGKMFKPNCCEDCGVKPERLHGHHEDYDKPLDVNWLCPLCHGKRHRKMVA